MTLAADLKKKQSDASLMLKNIEDSKLILTAIKDLAKQAALDGKHLVRFSHSSLNILEVWKMVNKDLVLEGFKVIHNVEEHGDEIAGHTNYFVQISW